MARLNLTNQMKDFILYAYATDRTLILYVRPIIRGVQQTKISKPLQAVIKQMEAKGLIKIKYLKKGYY